MVLNCYAQLANLKSDLVIPTTSMDGILTRLIEEVSRAIDDECKRFFYAIPGVRLYDSQRIRFWDGGYATGYGSERELWTDDDVISITQLAVDNDGSQQFNIMLTEGTDYWPWPWNQNPSTPHPYQRLDLNPYGGTMVAWPWGQRRIQVTGVFGYSYEIEDTGQDVADNPLSSGATTITVPSSAGISPGETLVIEEEQVAVQSIPDGTHLTVERGINGTTAASHANETVISRRRYPRPVERAVTMQASRLYKRRETAYANVVQNTDLGTMQIFRGVDPDIALMLQPYRRVAEGIA